MLTKTRRAVFQDTDGNAYCLVRNGGRLQGYIYRAENGREVATEDFIEAVRRFMVDGQAFRCKHLPQGEVRFKTYTPDNFPIYEVGPEIAQAIGVPERGGSVEPDAGPFGRRAIEAAMDAYEEFQATGANWEIFENFDEPRAYWVRSTKPRANRVFPTKPIVSFLTQKPKLNGGWTRGSAAARLHNAGFVIVQEDDTPMPAPARLDHLIGGADQIRLCALNYFIEPAREVKQASVEIRASDISAALGLENVFPNICSALGGKKLQELANVPKPTATQPNPSSSTTFTYQLASGLENSNMVEETDRAAPKTTNLILYGPPGTGKTYQTTLEAVRLCIGDADAEEFAASEQREALVSEYGRLVREGRIEFVTFHQSMSYEEFVEGLRPDTDGGAGFRLEPVPGVFRGIAARAGRGSLMMLEDDMVTLEGRAVYKMSIGPGNVRAEEYLFEEAVTQGHTLLGWEDIDFSDDRFEQIENILQACRDQGKRDGAVNLKSGQVAMANTFRNEMQVGDIIVVSKGNALFRAIGEVIGDYEYHPRDEGVYTQRRAVRWLWVDRNGVPATEIYDGNFTMRSIYRLDPKRLDVPALEQFMNSENVTDHAEPQPHVLIIDEINRANISKVFGELITLLEPDKRIGAANEIRLTLPYSKTSFGVPANLHIIGTMNTADRSIALLDTALRRRFSFRELMPDPDVLDVVDGIDLPKLLRTLNQRVEFLFDREHQIGHAYFTGCTCRADVEEVLRDRVIPLLAEYFYEDWSKVATVLGDVGGAARFLVREEIPVPPGLNSDGFDGPKLRWSVRQDRFDLSEFEA